MQEESSYSVRQPTVNHKAMMEEGSSAKCIEKEEQKAPPSTGGREGGLVTMDLKYNEQVQERM